MPKTIIGTVSSTSRNKTITVKVVSRRTHPLYQKQYLSTKKFTAHDEKNEAEVGDRVAIIETRPLSASKHFRLDRIIERTALEAAALAVTQVEEPVRTAKPNANKAKL
jgi:small subunit ribosomal protein S17